jgi:hypothetical protein
MVGKISFAVSSTELTYCTFDERELGILTFVRTLIELLNTGEIPEQKVRPPESLEPGLPLRLVRTRFAKRYLMKAKFWGRELLKSAWFFVHNIRQGSCE